MQTKHNPVDTMWQLIHLELPYYGKHLNFERMRALFRASFTPDAAISWHRLAAESITELLHPNRKLESLLQTLSGVPRALNHITREPGEADDIWFADEEVDENASETCERDLRMPGDVAIPGVEDYVVGCGEIYDTITTKAGKLYRLIASTFQSLTNRSCSIAFASADVDASLKSTFDFQFTVRIDPARGEYQMPTFHCSHMFGQVRFTTIWLITSLESAGSLNQKEHIFKS